MESTELSTTMYVQSAVYVADVVCNYCAEERRISKPTVLICVGYGPEALVPDYWCPKCGSRDMTEI
jgi:hypothetical protein